MINIKNKIKESKFKILHPHKNKLELLIADEIELSSFRDEIASMEHPFFALKAGDTKVREYKNGVTTIIIRPTAKIGLATVFDKDIWIYAISKLQELININLETNHKVYFTPYDFFITTNRSKSGKSYNDLKKALRRLKGTTIETNIIYSKEKTETENFSLIDQWRIFEEKKGNLNIGIVEITLPDWLYQALYKKKMLKINPDYFRIRKAIDRRIYEISRKHCGNQREFQISLEKLHLKTGSSAILKMFRYNIKQLVKSNDLPDYKISYDANRDVVIFNNPKI